MKPPIKNLVIAYYPNGHVTQFFGENPALYSKVCVNNGTSCLAGHNGIDIVSPWGTPIYNIETGKVVDVKHDPGGYGKHVRVLSDRFEYTYGHLSSIEVESGDKVKEGDLIGKMGNTGFVVSGPTPFWKNNPYAGTHLHVTMREIDPTKPGNVTYSSGETAHIKNWNNGFFGAINPTQYLPMTDTKAYVTQLQLTVISLARQIISLLQGKINKI